MYLPYSNRRWGKLAIISPFDSLKNHFNKGCLVFIKQNELSIAGYLITYEKGVPALILNGIRDGKPEYLKMGALVATYYYAILYLQNEGYHTVSLGYTRPFLRDGVLQHKKSWGLRVNAPGNTLFLIEPRSKTEAVDGFLLNNPFICLEKNQLCAKLFIKGDESADDSLKVLHHNLYVKGLSDFAIHHI
jgi:hypothetical protein